MDLANKEGGIVVGTSTSPISALGWSTFAGDHIAMYGVNASVPKTLVRRLVEWVAGHHASDPERDVLVSVLETPVSPESFPPAATGGSSRGPRTSWVPSSSTTSSSSACCAGGRPRKILFLAEHAFGSRYDAATLRGWLTPSSCAASSPSSGSGR